MTMVLRSYINGTWHNGVSSVRNVNPAHVNETVAEVSQVNASSVTHAIESAHAAFPAWHALPAPLRGDILRKAADLLEQRANTVGRDLTREEGKTLAEAIGETKRAVAILRYYSGQTLEPDGETYPSFSPNTFLYARREPVGVVVAITPWNFPIAIPTWKIAPALAYGNTVVWKPAEIVPLTAIHLLPAGVLNLVLGKGSHIGDVLITHHAVDAITFTGSNSVGRAIQFKAVEHGKKIQLELGGKNPVIVLADADLAHAAEQVARGAFLSAGQKCTATSRVIVEEPVLREFQERLVALAESWKLGDPLEPDTNIGPLSSKQQLKTVEEYLQLSKTEGGRVLSGGKAVNTEEGYYIQPTVLSNIHLDSKLNREEIFGPIAILLPATSYQEAVALANDTPFGLTACLFTNDLSKSMRFANDIRAGVVKINQESAGLEFQVPFGGMKESSSGSREQGKAAREFFTQWKTVYLDSSPSK